MAKVIGFDERHKHKVTCRNCSAIVEYVLSEVKAYHGKDYSGGSDGQEWVDCPNCNKEAIIRSW